jgi:hypothetical protein
MKYTAEELREAAATNEHPIPLRVRAMLTAYAARIEADEGAVPVAVRYFDGKNGDGSQHYVVYSLDRHRANVGAEPLFTHPPAQAAQGEASLGRCKTCGRATRSVCDGLDGNGLGCTNAPPIDLAALREVIEQEGKP